MAVLTFDEFLPKADSKTALTFDEFLPKTEPAKPLDSTGVLTFDEFLPKEEPTEEPKPFEGISTTAGLKYYREKGIEPPSTKEPAGIGEYLKQVFTPALASEILKLPEGITPGEELRRRYDVPYEPGTSTIPTVSTAFATKLAGDILDVATTPFTYVIPDILKQTIKELLASPKIGSILSKDIIATLTKKTVTTTIPEQALSITKQDVSNIHADLASKELADLQKIIPDWSKVAKEIFTTGESATVKVPEQSITQLVDRPYWAKIKSVFGKVAEPKPYVPPKAEGVTVEVKPKLKLTEIPPEKEVTPPVTEVGKPTPKVEIEKPILRTALAEQEGFAEPVRLEFSKSTPPLTKEKITEEIKKLYPESKFYVTRKISNLRPDSQNFDIQFVNPKIDAHISPPKDFLQKMGLKETLFRGKEPKTVEPPAATVPSELEPLAQEVRKFKTAEEFVQAQQFPNIKVVKGIESGKNLSYRGQSPGKIIKENEQRTATYGKGLYTTKDISQAKEYGEIHTIYGGIPKNPLILNQHGEFTDWLLTSSKEKNIREFNKKYPDLADYIKSKGYDGVQIGNGKDAEFVLYPKFSKQQLTDFYNQAKGVEAKPTTKIAEVGKPEDIKKIISGTTAKKEHVAKVISKELIPNKEEVLRQIDEAIVKAPEAETSPPRYNKEDMEVYKKKYGAISFKIDGGADILNTKQALQQFKDIISKAPKEIPKVKEGKGITIPKSTPKTRESLVKNFEKDVASVEGDIRGTEISIENIKSGEVSDFELQELGYETIEKYKADWVPRLEADLKGYKEQLQIAKENLNQAKGLGVIKKEPKTELEFLDQSPPIGMSVKQIVPVSIRIEREPKDLVGLKGFLESWVLPVRFIADKNPIANKIFHYGRDTITNLSNETTFYSERIDNAWKGLNLKEKELVVGYLEGKYPIETMPEKYKTAYQESDAIRREMYRIAEEDIGKDVSKWGIKPEEYFPHVFVGSYQIKDGTRTIEGGFARTLSEAMEKATDYLKIKPEADISIASKDFSDEYTATLLSRKGFWRFITEVKRATDLDKDEIMSMMKGVAAIKPRGKFVGNFLQRSANLGGYMKNELALKIYTNRILRKKWIDPFRKQATDWATSLPPALKQYFNSYIDDVSGKYNPYDNKFQVSKNVARFTSAQSKLKLGYRPITVLINRLQPMQTAYSEIGNYLFQGNKFKNTPEGLKVIEDSGVAGQLPKYYTGEFLATPKEPLYKPLGMFSKAEMANRQDVIAGGYLFAKKVFEMPPEKAIKMGYQYILNYLDEFKDPYKAAIEYTKDLNNQTNYIYDVSDLPRMMRTPFGRVLLQFKNFPINFTAQTIKWGVETFTKPSPHNTARFIRGATANILLGGVRTVPYAGRFLWKSLLFLPLVAGLNPKIREVIGRGIFSLLGIDLSQRLGPNEFLPRNLRDLAGPIGGDLYIIYKYFRGDITLGQALTQPVGAIRDIYRAMRESEYIADPNKRWRKIVETTGWDKFLQAIGSPVLKVEVTRDLQVIISQMEREYKGKKARYVDEIIARKKQNKSYTDILAEAKKEGIKIDWKDIFEEMKKKKQPALERRMETVPKDIKKEIKELTEKDGS